MFSLITGVGGVPACAIATSLSPRPPSAAGILHCIPLGKRRNVRAGLDAPRGGRGQFYLIDTSAQARSQHTMVRAIIADRATATCVTVDLEAGYSGRDLHDVRTIAGRRKELYVVLPISEVIADRARMSRSGWRPEVTTALLA